MDKQFKKQMIFGILGTLGSIGALMFTFTFAQPANKWIGMLLLAVFFGLIFGFLLYFFSGRKGFISGAAVGFCLVAFIELTYTLSRPYVSLLLFGMSVVFMAWPKIKEYRLNRAADKPEKGGKLVRQLEEEEAQKKLLQEEIEALKVSICFKEKSLLLGSSSGHLYQLIRGKDAFYFVMISGQLGGIKPELLKQDFSDESSYLGGKKDFKVPRSEIVSLTFKMGKTVSTPHQNSGKLTIAFGGRKKRFAVMDCVEVSELQAFFGDQPLTVRGKKQDLEDGVPLSETEERNVGRFKAVGLVLSVLSVVIPAAFLFLPFNYTLLSVLCILLPAVSFTLCLKYGGVFVIDDDDKVFKKKRVNLFVPILFPGLPLGLRSILDINVTDYRMLAVWSVLLFSCIVFLFFRFTKSRKGKRKSAAALILLAALFFAPSAVLQINYVFDFSASQVTSTFVRDKEIFESSNGPDTYDLTVSLKSGKVTQLKVTKELYDSVEKGSPIEVYECPGLLGIPYADAGAK